MNISPLGLTNHVEIITLNAIGYKNYGSNRTQAIVFNLFPSVKYLLGYCGLKTKDYDIYRIIGWDPKTAIIQPATRNDEIKRKQRYAFVNKKLGLDQDQALHHIFTKMHLPMPSRKLFANSLLD